jgi:hypothetical protein
MPASYTTSLKLTLPADGDTNWGTVVNNGITNLVDASVAGTTTVAFTTAADYTLTTSNGATDEARKMFLNFTGTPGAAANVICPAVSKLYFVSNNTTGGFSITVKTAAGTGIAVGAGTSLALYCNGTNVVYAVTPAIVAGSTTQVQYNNSGVFGASANLTFDGTNLTSNGVKVGRGLNNVATTTAVGSGALASTTGSAGGTTAVGANALTLLTSGINNTAVGANTLTTTTVGYNNTAVGAFAAWKATGTDNTATGTSALQAITTGFGNTAIGSSALSKLETAINNTAVGGTSTLTNNISSVGNTAVGVYCLSGVTGQENTAIGYFAGANITSGGNNSCIGRAAYASSATVNNEITLGDSSITTLRCQVTSITSLSDARDKTNIQPLIPGLNFINRLSPVSFDWNMRDGGKIGVADTGFIAQDLQACQSLTQEFIPGLVYAENPNKLEAAYGKLIPVLVKAIQELTARVAELEGK